MLSTTYCLTIPERNLFLSPGDQAGENLAARKDQPMRTSLGVSVVEIERHAGIVASRDGLPEQRRDIPQLSRADVEE